LAWPFKNNPRVTFNQAQKSRERRPVVLQSVIDCIATGPDYTQRLTSKALNNRRPEEIAMAMAVSTFRTEWLHHRADIVRRGGASGGKASF
jgi:hypothetical protein